MTESNVAQVVEPFDPKCGRFARDMLEIDWALADGESDEVAEATPEQRDAYIREEEGTYNPENGHFLCDNCYIAVGMPSGPNGWRCP